MVSENPLRYTVSVRPGFFQRAQQVDGEKYYQDVIEQLKSQIQAEKEIQDSQNTGICFMTLSNSDHAKLLLDRKYFQSQLDDKTSVE